MSMDSKRKNIIIIIVTLVFAAAFISSFASLGNFGSTTTTVPANSTKTFFVTGSANAVVSGYGYSAYVGVNSNSTDAVVANVLAKLEANGSVSDYYSQGNGYEVLFSSMTPYQLQQLLNISKANTSAYLNATSFVHLPVSIPIIYGGQQFSIQIPQTNYSLGVTPLLPVNSIVGVSIHALVTGNGTVYNGNLQLTLLKKQ
ncbi:MAG: hypothetical protein M1504_03605 [Candidatus Marsarchaeota archaeon]|nr:hypothetical protein [Candidatus Marsarchaeota archaeon]